MKIDAKRKKLMNEGFSEKTLSAFSSKEISLLYKKFVNEQILNTKAVTMVSSKNPNAAEIAKDLNTKGINVSMTEVEDIEEKEEEEKNPWAICHAQLGPRKNAKFESCVRQVKKSLKEGKNPLTLFIENKIMEMVSKHTQPRITKSDLMKYLNEAEPSVAPKPGIKEPKPGTKTPPKPKPSHPGKNPNPGENPAPKAIKPEEAKSKVIDTIVKILKNG